MMVNEVTTPQMGVADKRVVSTTNQAAGRELADLLPVSIR
jgi:hypothetical protein